MRFGATSGKVWMIDTTNTNPSFIFHVNGDGSVTKVSEHEFSRDWVYVCIGG